MSKRILFIGTPVQSRYFRDNPGKFVDDYSVEDTIDFCNYDFTIVKNISGLGDNFNPESSNRENWKTPDVVVYTGELRTRTPNGIGLYVEAPNDFEEYLNGFGIEKIIKLNWPV